MIDIPDQIVSIAGIDSTYDYDIREDEYQVGCVIFTGLSTSPDLMIVEEFHNHGCVVEEDIEDYGCDPNEHRAE